MDLQLRLCKSVTHPECVLSSKVDHDADVRLDVIDSFLPGCSCKTEVCPEDGGQATAYNIHLMENSSIQQLELDVQRLQQLLQEEKEVHAVLQSAVEHAVVDLSCHPCLPNNAQELLSNIATLEVTILKLQEEMVSLHFQLIQERNERRLAEYRLKQLPSQPLPICLCGNVEAQDATDAIHIHSEKMSLEQFQHVMTWRFKRQILVDGLWSHPNLLAEEMVRCMKNIFITLADSSISSTKSSSWESHPSSTSPFGRLSSSSFWSLSESLTISPKMQSPQVDLLLSKEVIASGNAFDPYNVREKLSWVDIGSYSLAIEVSWMSVGKQQLEYAAGALRRFSSLIEQLAKVNPIHLSGNEKLAFWINLYNALIMHAYLAYGVPKSDLKLLSLMQKAAYTVGGHSFSAACIEYAILKMKPPAYRPQIALLLALQKLKVSEEQKKFSVETPDPLIAFALSCGMYSSPAVKIYSPRSLREELQAAQRDFIRASVGISSKGKLLVPKMLYCFAKGFVDDSNLAVWISSFLPQQQAMLVEHCMSQRRQSFLGSRSCGILPFDPRFRYLFLPESEDVAKDPSCPQSSLAPDRS